MLPQIGLVELLVLGVVALIVVGPRDLPALLRNVGRWVGRAKAMAADFRGAFDDMGRQIELEELRKEIEEIKKSNEAAMRVDLDDDAPAKPASKTRPAKPSEKADD